MEERLKCQISSLVKYRQNQNEYTISTVINAPFHFPDVIYQWTTGEWTHAGIRFSGR